MSVISLNTFAKWPWLEKPRYAAIAETDLSVFAPALMSKIRTAVSNVTGLRVMDVKLLIDQAKPAAK